MTSSSKTTPNGRLKLATILPFSAPSLPLSAVGIAVFVYLPNYFASHLRVGLPVIGAVWGLVRMLDIPVDVVLAVFMDRTRTVVGRYRAWLILGVPILMLALYRLFMAPAGFSGTYLLSWLLVFYLGTSILNLAHSAWAANVATHYHERSRLFGILNAVGVVGTMAAIAIVIFGKQLGLAEAEEVPAMGWFAIVLLPFAVGLAALMTPEKLAPEIAKRGFPLRDYWEVLSKPDLLRLFAAQLTLTLGPGWMSALYLFFFEKARGFSAAQASTLLAVYIFAQIPGSFASAALARRIGKHRALIVASTGFSLGLLSIFITPKADIWAALPSLFWSGLMAAGFDLMIRAMLADMGDEIRLKQGQERISLLYAVNGLAAKIAGAISIAVAFPLLAALGFNPHEGAVNTRAAIDNLQWTFLLGPLVFVMLGGACVIGWRMNAQRHGEVRAALEARDASLETTLATGWSAPMMPPADPEIAI